MERANVLFRNISLFTYKRLKNRYASRWSQPIRVEQHQTSKQQQTKQNEWSNSRCCGLTDISFRSNIAILLFWLSWRRHLGHFTSYPVLFWVSSCPVFLAHKHRFNWPHTNSTVLFAKLCTYVHVYLWRDFGIIDQTPLNLRGTRPESFSTILEISFSAFLDCFRAF